MPGLRLDYIMEVTSLLESCQYEIFDWGETKLATIKYKKQNRRRYSKTAPPAPSRHDGEFQKIIYEGWIRDTSKDALYCSDRGEIIAQDISGNELLGEFSYACVSQGQAVLLTDFYGTCPIYIHNGSNGHFWLAANDLRLLLAHPSISRRFSVDACRLYLEDNSIVGENELAQTFFEGISKMPPNAVLTLDKSGASLRRRPSLQIGPEIQNCGIIESQHKWLELYRSTLNQCVLDRVLGGGRGLMLSGGIDSASVLGAWVDSGAADLSPPKCVNLAFKDAELSNCQDREIAENLCAAAGVHLHTIWADDCLRFPSPDDTPAHLDGPEGYANPLGVHKCVEFFSNNEIGAILTGEGGDALLGEGTSRMLHDSILRHEGMRAVSRYFRLSLGIDHGSWSIAPAYLKSISPKVHIWLLNRKVSNTRRPRPAFLLTAANEKGNNTDTSNNPLRGFRKFGKYAAHFDLAAMLFPRAAYFDAMHAAGSHFHPYLDPRMIFFNLACPPHFQHETRSISRRNPYASSKFFARHAYSKVFGPHHIQKNIKTDYNFMCRKMLFNSRRAMLELSWRPMRLSSLGLVCQDRFRAEALAYALISCDSSTALGERYHYLRAAIDLENWLSRFDENRVLRKSWLYL